MNDRFTIDGSQALENHLAHLCEEVLAGVRKILPGHKLEALLLGGGYGRGEGGVLTTSAGDAPYNDLEFYLFVRGNSPLNERRYRGALHTLANSLSSRAKLEIEFKVLSLAKLRRSPVSMFYYDLLLGHRWLWGDERLWKGCERHRVASQIPLAEATRLLMNRCSGLLFAKERLERDPFAPEDADFAGRNLAKAQLAFGDAVLAASGQYHWSCRERHHRLEKFQSVEDLPWLAQVQQEHLSGLEFKLNPYRSTAPRQNLLEQHAHLTALGLRLWLWVESRRLQVSFSSISDYALSAINKCPETTAWRNRFVNAKAFGPRALFSFKANRHPRQRLLHSLALLLWEPATLQSASSDTRPDLARLGKVQEELNTKDTAWPALIEAYRKLWSRFN